MKLDKIAIIVGLIASILTITEIMRKRKQRSNG